MRAVLLTLTIVAAAVLPGCKSNCRVLSEKLCDCSLNSTERTSCLNAASTAEANFIPTAADDATCAALVKSCDCRLIDTAEGKMRCGLAWSTDAGQ